MKKEAYNKVISLIENQVKPFKTPAVTVIGKKKNPYLILISCIISLRTKDDVTEKASERLFKLAKTADEMIKLSGNEIEKAIYPAGFYKIKAKNILEISETLINRYSSKVPDTLEELLKLKGVGRKTANLVITVGFNKDGICVDTHVHRISNRLGWVKTKSPEETEFALKKELPKKYWIPINDLLVTFGQNVCLPLSPKCSICNVEKLCPKTGVMKRR